MCFLVFFSCPGTTVRPVFAFLIVDGIAKKVWTNPSLGALENCSLKKISFYWLVVSTQLKKSSSKFHVISPGGGENKQCLSCHHLVIPPERKLPIETVPTWILHRKELFNTISWTCWGLMCQSPIETYSIGKLWSVERTVFVEHQCNGFFKVLWELLGGWIVNIFHLHTKAINWNIRLQ